MHSERFRAEADSICATEGCWCRGARPKSSPAPRLAATARGSRAFPKHLWSLRPSSKSRGKPCQMSFFQFRLSNGPPRPGMQSSWPSSRRLESRKPVLEGFWWRETLCIFLAERGGGYGLQRSCEGVGGVGRISKRPTLQAHQQEHTLNSARRTTHHEAALSTRCTPNCIRSFGPCGLSMPKSKSATRRSPDTTWP